MQINGNTISWFGCGGSFHVVSYTYDRSSVYIVPEDLTRSDFGGFTNVRVYPDKLTTTMMVCDMNMPLSVFAREDMLDKIEIPSGARVAPRNTMMYCPPDSGYREMPSPLANVAKPAKFCPECGTAAENDTQKYCCECGSRLPVKND